MAVRGVAVQRRQPEGRVDDPTGAALLQLVVHALPVDGAALFLSSGSPSAWSLEASGGRVPPPALPPPAGEAPPPWTERLEVVGRHARGLLLLAPSAATGLTAAERLLATRVGGALADLAAHGRIVDEVAHMRELLARADRLSTLGLLTAGLTHEIRNPLVSVRTFVQLLPERLRDEEFLTGFRDLALGEIERICGLLNDLLAFSRPAPSTRDPTDLNEVVGQIQRLLEAEARKDDVTLTCDLDPALPTVVVDGAQLKQVLMNVVLNAVQASAAPGRVEITTRREGPPGDPWCIVAVSDSGPGIAPDDLPQIFDPFFTTKDAGSGLGLFIARQIVTEHGGLIVPSTRKGGGSVFAVHLPANGAEHVGARA